MKFGLLQRATALHCSAVHWNNNKTSQESKHHPRVWPYYSSGCHGIQRLMFVVNPNNLRDFSASYAHLCALFSFNLPCMRKKTRGMNEDPSTSSIPSFIILLFMKFCQVKVLEEIGIKNHLSTSKEDIELYWHHMTGRIQIHPDFACFMLSGISDGISTLDALLSYYSRSNVNNNYSCRAAKIVFYILYIYQND